MRFSLKTARDAAHPGAKTRNAVDTDCEPSLGLHPGFASMNLR